MFEIEVVVLKKTKVYKIALNYRKLKLHDGYPLGESIIVASWYK